MLGKQPEHNGKAAGYCHERLESANEQLREDMEHITELSRQRRGDFFAAASHELKTPITILKGQIESMILGIGKYKDTGKVLPETLKEVREYGAAWVKEILTISKIEMDGLGRKADAGVAAGHYYQSHRNAAPRWLRSDRLPFILNLPRMVTVSGNASLLEKTIHNILSNAIRHSPEEAEVFIHLTPSVLTVTKYWHFYPGRRSACAVHAFLPGGKIPEQIYARQRPGACYLVKTILEFTWIPISGWKIRDQEWFLQ